MRFDEYLRHVNKVGGELIEIPNTNVFEYLNDYCTPEQSKKNYDLTMEWSNEYSDTNPKFVFVAFAMVLFKSFNFLTQIDPNDKKYDSVLNGFWRHYLGIPRKDTLVPSKPFLPPV